MGVRLETRGPFAVYKFERGSTTRVTLELPAIILPPPLPPKRSPVEPSPLQGSPLQEPI